MSTSPAHTRQPFPESLGADTQCLPGYQDGTGRTYLHKMRSHHPNLHSIGNHRSKATQVTDSATPNSASVENAPLAELAGRLTAGKNEDAVATLGADNSIHPCSETIVDTDILCGRRPRGRGQQPRENAQRILIPGHQNSCSSVPITTVDEYTVVRADRDISV